jgi:hypothetical protein
MTRSSAITTDLLESSQSDGGKAIVDFTFVKDGIHPIVRCTFTEKCLDYNFAPILKKGKWNESWYDFGSAKYLIFGNNATNPSDLNDLKDSGVYVVQRTTATTTANFPSDFPTDASRATLEIYNNVYDSSRNIVVQVLSSVTGYDKWWRIYNSQSDSWVSWTKISLPALPAYVTRCLPVSEYQLYGDKVTNPDDLNGLTDSEVRIIQRTAATTTSNFPTNYPTDGSRATLEVFKSKFDASVTTSVQVLTLLTSVSRKWWRVYNHSSEVWSSWEEVTVTLPANINRLIPTSEYQLYGSKATNPDDLNSLTENEVRIIQRTAETTTLHFPSDFPTDASRATLEVFKSKFDASVTTSVQVLTMLTDTYKKWWRVYNHSSKAWNDWVRSDVSDGALEFHVGSGYQYATLRSAVEAANLFQNAKVIIHNGTYDLLVEYADKLNDCFNGNVVGVQLKNGIHILAMDGTKVTANVPDDGTYTDEQLSALGQYFNPFYSNFNNSFTLENLEIEATNTRYCVHDEHGGVGTYVHKYFNCKMKFANTISRSGIAKYVACIGGGLGEHGTIVVDGGRYESHTVNGASHIGGGDPENHQNCISYHNGNSATCDSSIRITGVYLADRGYIKFGYYGPSTIKSFCEVSGCSLGLPLVIGKEANNDAPVNYDVVSWGNEQKVEGVHWEVGSDGYTQNLVSDS